MLLSHISNCCLLFSAKAHGRPLPLQSVSKANTQNKNSHPLQVCGLRFSGGAGCCNSPWRGMLQGRGSEAACRETLGWLTGLTQACFPSPPESQSGLCVSPPHPASKGFPWGGGKGQPWQGAPGSGRAAHRLAGAGHPERPVGSAPFRGGNSLNHICLGNLVWTFEMQMFRSWATSLIFILHRKLGETQTCCFSEEEAISVPKLSLSFFDALCVQLLKTPFQNRERQRTEKWDEVILKPPVPQLQKLWWESLVPLTRTVTSASRTRSRCGAKCPVCRDCRKPSSTHAAADTGQQPEPCTAALVCSHLSLPSICGAAGCQPHP